MAGTWRTPEAKVRSIAAMRAQDDKRRLAFRAHCLRHARQPTHVHPLVSAFFNLLRRESVLVIDIARRCGMSSQCLYDWRANANPSLPNFVAALNVIGYDLKIVPLRDAPGFGIYDREPRRRGP